MTSWGDTLRSFGGTKWPTQGRPAASDRYRAPALYVSAALAPVADHLQVAAMLTAHTRFRRMDPVLQSMSNAIWNLVSDLDSWAHTPQDG